MDVDHSPRENGHGPDLEDPARVLSSWKEIADFLRVSPRTAQQYEKTRGLPVRRMGNRPTISVRDLHTWQLSSLRSARWWERQRVLQIWAVTASSLFLFTALTLAVFWQRTHGSGAPASLRWNGAVLSAHDAKNRFLWSRVFPHVVSETNGGHSISPWLGDIDNDGHVEVILPYLHVERESEGWHLYCLSASGEERWQLQVTRNISSKLRTFKPPYVLRGFSVFPSPEKDGSQWIAAVFVHHVEYPSVLSVVDSRGTVRGEYWHPGHFNDVKTVDFDGDGIQEILAGGVRHGAEQAMIVVFDSRDVAGTAPPEETTPHELVGMRSSSEKAVIYFPRSALNKKFEQFNFLNNIQVVDNMIQATVYERLSELSGYLIYVLTKDWTVQSLTPSVSYKNAITLLGSGGEVGRELREDELDSLRSGVRVKRY